jgi:predicted amidophosphoribosyltransferase
MRFWRPEDIFDVVCPVCQNEIEFWKDEPMRVCSQCKREILNPKMDLSCTDWCTSANACVGKAVTKDK